MRRSPNAILTIGFILLLFLAAGCGKASEPVHSLSLSGTGYPLTIADSQGYQLTLSAPPQRLVSLAPSNTEILFSLGLGDRVVGVTSYCNYPEEATKIEQIGGFSSPSIEKIVALQPDLVLAAGRHSKEVGQLRQLGINVMVLDASRVDQISGLMRMVGQACGVPQKGDELGSQIDSRIASIKLLVAKSPTRPLVFYELFNEPITTAGGNSMIGDLITICGGVNLAADAAAEYPQYSAEAIISRNPDIIIQCSSHGSMQLDKSKYPAEWQGVTAVQTGKIYAIDGNISTRSGPRILEALDAFLACIHPELSASSDPGQR